MGNAHAFQYFLNHFFALAGADFQVQQGQFYIFENIEFVDEVKLWNTKPMFPFANWCAGFRDSWLH
jgi:hypothetical protein